MERVFKWLTLALIAIEVALVRFGLLDLGTAVGIVVGIELLLLVVAGRQIIVAVRRYRRNRAEGLDVWAALEDGLAVLLPRPVARIVAMEPQLWTCLAKWIFQRKGPSEDEFRYHKRSLVGPLLVVVLFTTPVELLLFELLIPWTWLRWLLLIAAIYMLIWAFGLYASIVTLPHRLEHAGLRLRYGILASGRIPYSEIASVEQERRQSPGWTDGLRLDRKESAAYLAIGSRTDITLRLQTAQQFQGLLGLTAPVRTVYLAADDPDEMAKALRERLLSAITSS